jgi:hypothetical protein
MELTNQQIIEYLQRSYTALDGLWFMKVEERCGFDAALAIDQEVWKVLPKIQARKLKTLTGSQCGLDALQRCFTIKLRLDGFEFAAEPLSDGLGFRIVTLRCPWHEKMIASRREHLSAKVGDCICPTEYGAWAAEFGPGISFHLEEQICRGAARCVLCFRKATPADSDFLK